jgi:hypothetical protein
LAAGVINLAAGLWILAVCWPAWSIQAPADVAFLAVSIVAAANVAAALFSSRLWRLLLPANALCGLIFGMFAALHFEAFWPGVLGAAAGTVPSLIAFAFQLRQHLQ